MPTAISLPRESQSSYRASGRPGQDPDQVDREQDLPAEPHELVVAQPGQRAPQPDEDEQQQERPW